MPTLNFILRNLGKRVAYQLSCQLSSINLLLPFQSAYRKYKSTKTALLLRSQSHKQLHGQKVTALVLLDLSAPFDTVDHDIVFHRLGHWFGLSGSALSWFASCLQSRT